MFAIVGTLFGIAFTLFIFAIGIVGTIFWIWMLVDCLTNRGIETGEKIVWVIAIALTHFIGAIIYFLVGRPKGRLGMGA